MENNGKWKLQTCFTPNYDFAFTNLQKLEGTVVEVLIILN
jgi:hypothetical protein